MKNSPKSRNLKKDSLGMIGIGTMIVFISLVTVSTTAAGIIMETGTSLEQEAKATVNEATSGISSGVNVIDALGQTDEDGEIENLKILVKPYPGAGVINLENTMLQFRSDYNVKYLHWYDAENNVEDNFNPNSEFYVKGIRSTSNSGPTKLIDTGDLSEIHIQLTADNKLKATDEAVITMIPNTGFETYYRLMVPAALTGNRWYRL